MKPARIITLAAGISLLAGVLLASAPSTSPRPKPRPYTQAVPVSHAAPFLSLTTVLVSPRPVHRPATTRNRATLAASGHTQSSQPARATTRRGSVCGVRDIRGEKIARIPGKIAGCGVENPVRVTSVGGVGLSQASVMDCTTAKALNSWVKNGITPAVGRLGGGVQTLRVAAHYSCRTRNNQPGAKISEHGKGHAVDISGLILRNGVTITVKDGWRNTFQRRIIQAMHSSACGTFGTVLGPNADRYHQDHLHVDTARYRGGAYCR